MPQISHHFADKRALYGEVVAIAVADAFDRGMAEARAEGDLAAGIAAFVNGAHAGPSTASLMAATLPEAWRDVELRADGQLCVNMIQRFARWAITEATASGEVRLASPSDVAALTELLVSLIFGFFVHRGFTGADPVDARSVRTLFAVHGQRIRRPTAGSVARGDAYVANLDDPVN